MPYDWLTPDTKAPDHSGAFAQSASPDLLELRLWPYRSLPAKGFVIFIGVTAALMAMPLLATIGSAALWVLLAFICLALAAIWWALTRNIRDGRLTEVLRIAPDRIELIRQGPRQADQNWAANPYWVTVQLYKTDGPVPEYLTLKGNGREVELGAFLTPGERLALAGELRHLLPRRN